MSDVVVMVSEGRDIPVIVDGSPGVQGAQGPAGSNGFANLTPIAGPTFGANDDLARVVVPVHTSQIPGLDTESDIVFTGHQSSFPVPMDDTDVALRGLWYTTISSSFGQNYTKDLARENTDMPALGLFWEIPFRQENTWAAEFQFRHYCTDLAPGLHNRVFQGFFPFTSTERDKATLQCQVDRLRYHDWTDSQAAEWNLRTGDFNAARLSFRFPYGTVPLKQVGPSAATHNLLTINARTELQMDEPIYQVTGPRTNVNAVSAHLTRQLASPVAGGYGEQVIGDAVTGNFNAKFYQQSVSGVTLFTKLNSHATGQVMDILQSVGGDVMHVLEISGVQWAMGHKASNNHLIFANYNNLAVYPALDIADEPEGFKATFTGPVRLPSFTVAGVPSAATMGAGSMIYVSNETGGAVVAFSDGTDWRRMTDRAVIA